MENQANPNQEKDDDDGGGSGGGNMACEGGGSKPDAEFPSSGGAAKRERRVNSVRGKDECRNGSEFPCARREREVIFDGSKFPRGSR